MPGKTVRFAEGDEIYVYSNMPSPSFSTSTLSSASLMTPPSVERPLSPSTPKSSPNRRSDVGLPITLHPVLVASAAPLFELDFAYNPSRTLPQTGVLTPRVLKEAATQPAIQSMTIKCQYLPWSIRITPASPKPDAYVTVADALSALYCALRLNVTREEYECEHPARRQAISDAFERRCSRYGNSSEEERRKGLKRVDFLVDKHRFRGFSSFGQPDVWRLHVSS